MLGLVDVLSRYCHCIVFLLVINGYKAGESVGCVIAYRQAAFERDQGHFERALGGSRHFIYRLEVKMFRCIYVGGLSLSISYRLTWNMSFYYFDWRN